MVGNRYPVVLLGVYAVVFIALAIDPVYRQDWLLESILPVIAIAMFTATCRNLRFTDFAYTALFLFLVLHTIGSHYTYSEVPAGFWAADAFGWERNHYDRLVHFLYGFMLAPLAVELFDAKAPPRGIWRYLMPVMFLAAHSVIYEIVEWWAAEIFGGELGHAFLGTQGDIWDAQKDSALALLGAALGTAIVLLLPGRPAASREPQSTTTCC